MLNKRFWSFIAGLTVLCLTTTACRPTASNPTAANQPATVGAASPPPEPTLPVAASVQRGEAKAVSGAYGAVLLGIGENGEITGYYSNSTGAGQYNCDFYIRGKLQNDAAEVKTWFPKDKQLIRGQLKFVEADGKPGINLKLAEEPGGCGMVDGELDDPNGSTHILDEPGEWQAVRVVSAAKAFFHSRPNTASKQKTFVVEYDAVRVYKAQNGWIEAEFGDECVEAERSQCKTTRGWLKKADLFSPEPPQ